MEKTYKAVDLCKFCKMESDIVYLIISGSNKLCRNHDTTKKIRVAPKRFLEMKFEGTETVRVVIKNLKIGRYSVTAVPCDSNGIYDLHQFLLKNGIKNSLLDFNEWQHMRYCYGNYIEDVTIYDNVVTVGSGVTRNRMIPTDKSKFEDTDICLKKISYVNMKPYADEVLFEKCVNGNMITAKDFETFFESSAAVIDIDFGGLQFNVGMGMITTSKKLSSSEEIGEEIIFRFKQSRVPDLTMFLDFVLVAEAENKLVERINKYFIF